MDEDKLLLRADIAKRFFFNHYPTKADDADEFVQFCVEQWLSGRHIATELRWMAVDYFRKLGTVPGSSKHVGLDIYNRHERNALETSAIDEAIDPQDPTTKIEAFQELRLSKDSPNHRCIFVLRHYWGFSLNEIGLCFGVTRSRVSQILSAKAKG